VLTQVLLPFAVAMYLILSFVYGIDPVLALLRRYEVKIGCTARITEEHWVTLHQQHALAALGVAVLATAALTILYVFVPGHRL